LLHITHIQIVLKTIKRLDQLNITIHSITIYFTKYRNGLIQVLIKSLINTLILS